ncbi:E3 ubiquitin ligase BIG BROTHER-related [Phytophthora ramorum]|uniref:RING-type domain-containing protein n=1 Tax=Phytophthora ramorum TaxID=164328 RepID=H3GY58_PHYRM|nr:E3 ubiquitin ligase BIG BROTHER-related [Phytophthora ramorum]
MGTGEALHIPRADPSSMSAYLPPQPYNSSGVRPDGPPYLPPGSCLVCYNPQVDVLLEPCHHQFHASCIERWLSKDKVCPTCWTPIQAPRRLVPQQYAQPQQQDGGGYPADSKAHVLEAAEPPTPAASADASAQPPAAMRKGKWTAEESAYCDRLIEEFKKGNLPLAEGTTLRTFLSKLLNCDPMRISKKYTGDQCIGKIIFRRREDDVSKDDMESIRKDLAELEKTYLEREQYNQRRREKRLESELSRDKSRFAATRSIGYAAAGNSAPMRPPHPQQQQQQGGYPQAAVQPMTKQEPRPGPGPVQQPNYGAPGRGGMPVQPPLHPPQQSNNVPSHLFNGDHSNVSMLGIAGAQTQGQGQVPNQDNKPASSSAMDGGDGFPRVSSIDSFSCLFPRVASIENFQHATSSGFGGMNSVGSYPSTETQNTMTSSGFDAQPSGLPKPLSIGEGLNAYFPRIQSLEQLSNLLQDHGPNSPRGGATSSSTQNSRDTMENSSDSKQQIKDNFTSGGHRRRLGENGIKEEQPREADFNAQTGPSSSNNSSNSSSSSDSSAVSTSMSVTTGSTSTGLTKRLSPSHNASASSGSGNQIQIPKPLNKMPRSSSGIFPRVPSMDKMPRVPSLDKMPRVASLDKLPRIPSMDKLHTVGGGEQRIPRVPSMDKMARVPSSDMLSRFGSSDHLSSFPSFSNLSTLSSSASYDKLSSLGGFKSGFPRNSSIEDILSLVASSESTGLPSNGSTLQLSALAAVAGEESSHIANERKRRLESSQQDASLASDNKKSKLSA